MSESSALPFLRIENVTKRYGGPNSTAAVSEANLSVARGEFFSLLGASGSGKTTLLRMLAGFETPDAGRIFIDDRDVTDLPPYDRPVNMMFQSYALFPHMSVADNIAFGLRQDGMPKAQRAERVAEMLELVHLTPMARRRPHQLSGGERQRVALARALAKRPKLLLLDEPLGALDRKLREKTQFELRAIQARLGITFVMVTHDQDEAMSMSDRLAVMERGRILQIGAPREVYESPATRHVAEFLGAANLIDGRTVGWSNGLARISCDGLNEEFAVAAPEAIAEGTLVSIAVRPEKIALSAAKEPPKGNYLRGTVRDIAYIGDVSTYNMALADGRILRVQETNARRDGAHLTPIGTALWLSWQPDDSVALAE